MPRSAAASPHSLLAELDGGIRSGKCYVNRCQRFPFGWLADRSCASSSAATCSVLARARVALAVRAEVRDDGGAVGAFGRSVGLFG